MRYIAGNNINIALKKAKEVLKQNKLPIINYIIEYPSDKLKIYNDETHPHEVQKPTVIDFKKLNKRNIIKN